MLGLLGNFQFFRAKLTNDISFSEDLALLNSRTFIFFDSSPNFTLKTPLGMNIFKNLLVNA